LIRWLNSVITLVCPCVRSKDLNLSDGWLKTQRRVYHKLYSKLECNCHLLPPSWGMETCRVSQSIIEVAKYSVSAIHIGYYEQERKSIKSRLVV
jgi:hypothetical protein